MALGGNPEVGRAADIVYEPLPEMDSAELARLRAVIGMPDVEAQPIWPRPRHAKTIDLSDEPVVDFDATPAPPAHSLIELLEEVDRKLEKLLHAGPAVPSSNGVGASLNALHCEVDDMRHRVEQLQTSLDALTRSLLGHQ